MTQPADPRKAQTRGLFNTICAEYDFGPGCFAHFGARLVDAARIEPGQRILDVATGRGAVLFPAAERVGSSGEAVGIDLAEEMVKATAAQAERRGLPAKLRIMDAEQLDLPDAYFDRVLCGFGIMFFPDQAGALAEMRRVLKPGGRLAVSTWRVSQGEDLAEVVAQLGHGAANPPGWISDPSALEQLLSRSGFRDVRVKEDAHEFRYSGIDEYWQQARGTGLRRVFASLDAAQTQALRAAFTERVKPHQRADGLYLAASALIAVATRD